MVEEQLIEEQRQTAVMEEQLMEEQLMEEQRQTARTHTYCGLGLRTTALQVVVLNELLEAQHLLVPTARRDAERASHSRHAERQCRSHRTIDFISACLSLNLLSRSSHIRMRLRNSSFMNASASSTSRSSFFFFNSSVDCVVCIMRDTMERAVTERPHQGAVHGAAGWTKRASESRVYLCDARYHDLQSGLILLVHKVIAARPQARQRRDDAACTASHRWHGDTGAGRHSELAQRHRHALIHCRLCEERAVLAALRHRAHTTDSAKAISI